MYSLFFLIYNVLSQLCPVLRAVVAIWGRSASRDRASRLALSVHKVGETQKISGVV